MHLTNAAAPRGREKLVVLVNYIGQLRPYSYADILLLLAWLNSSWSSVAGASMLWFGFLVYLEWQHRDRGRLHWHWLVWISLWICGIAILSFAAVPFVIAAVLYSQKKRFPVIAIVSCLINGLVKGLLLLSIGVADFRTLVVVGVMSFRNLMGDLRDVDKDREEGVQTLPVHLRVAHSIPLVYPITLLLTSLLWIVLGHTNFVWLVAAWGVQLLTYSWTPR